MTTTDTSPELNVPIVDLSKVIDNGGDDDDVEMDDKVVKLIAHACSEYGFFQVINHGVPQSIIDEYLDQCRRYFALSRPTKLQWKRNEGNSRGYFDDELTKQKRDWKEALDFGVPRLRTWVLDDDSDESKCLDGWNQFPSDDELPGFRDAATTYFDACADLADRIATLMAKGLGVRDAKDSPMIRELREKHSSYLRSNYYPPCDDTNNNLGISPHRDAGFLTVLLQDDNTHSLQVWKDGHWITVHPEPGAFTINTGDMAQIYSNGRYKAPLHRVLANESRERYSFPFFYNPSYETSVKPLDSNELKNVTINKTNCGDDGSNSKTTTSPTSSSWTTTKEDSAVKVQYNECIWGYYRAVRFAGDLTDLGVEIQVEDFLKREDVSINPHIMKQKIFAEKADFSVPFNVDTYRPLLTQSPQD